MLLSWPAPYSQCEGRETAASGRQVPRHSLLPWGVGVEEMSGTQAGQRWRVGSSAQPWSKMSQVGQQVAGGVYTVEYHSAIKRTTTQMDLDTQSCRTLQLNLL